LAIPENLEELLRRLTLGDENAFDNLAHDEVACGLDHRTSALVLIAALVALEAEGASYQVAIDRAHAAGLDDEEILEAVVVISPLVGAARLGSAVPELSAAFGIEQGKS
jgi:alkylhydroperoxidase/carboxymuconolactone decarboxylase family protein YurZ